MYEPFIIYFRDEETVDEIFEGMSRDLVHKLNMSHYLDEHFQTLNFSYDDYLKTIEKFIVLMKKTIDPAGIRRANFT
jgi:hypothetical protein